MCLVIEGKPGDISKNYYICSDSIEERDRLMQAILVGGSDDSLVN